MTTALRWRTLPTIGRGGALSRWTATAVSVAVGAALVAAAAVIG